MDAAGSKGAPVNRAVVVQHQQSISNGSEIPKPQIVAVAGNVAGRYASTPLGVILHGTRSGQPYTTSQEYDAAIRFVRGGAGGLGWSITCGIGVIAVHMTPQQWGWNARGASSKYLACEFAQANLGDPIDDGQVDAFCWWFRNVAQVHWPNIPMHFPNHSDLPEGISDGKSDVEPRGQHSVRDRILTRLG